MWSVPVAGGVETLVIPEVRQRLWAVAAEGIAFVAMPAPAAAEIRWFDLRSHRTSVLTRLPDGDVQTGFSVTRDALTAVWSRTDRLLHDLMGLEGWTP